MRLRVDEIPDSGRFLHYEWGQENLSRFLPPDDPFELRAYRPIRVDIELQKHPDHVKIDGKITGFLQVACHRCLADFSFALDEVIDLSMVCEDEAPQQEETELEGDELRLVFFDGEVIEVDHLVAEQVFLALPFKVLCSEDCRGLCPGCGVNLNEEDCRCFRDSTSSVFRKLEVVKKKLPPQPL